MVTAKKAIVISFSVNSRYILITTHIIPFYSDIVHACLNNY